MPEELIRVLSHEACRVSGFFLDRHSTAFISDDELALALAADLQHVPLTLNRVLKDFSRIALGTCVQVYFYSNQDLMEGISSHKTSGSTYFCTLVCCYLQINLKSGTMDTLAVRELLQALPSLAETFCSRGSDSVEDGQNDEIKNLYLDVALVNLMGRYGHISNPLERHDDDLAQSPTQVPAIAAHLIGNSDGDGGPGNLSLTEQDIKVRLLLECARGVGRVDVFSGADLYCAAFVGYWGKDQGNGEDAGNVLFQTSIRRGKSEADWIWNEVGCVLRDVKQ